MIAKNFIEKTQNNCQQTLSDKIDNLSVALKKAEEVSIPTKSHRSQKKKSWVSNHKIKQAARESKALWWKWKKDGSHKDSKDKTYLAMRAAKKLLRKAHRQIIGKSHREKLMKIMERKGDDKTFYKLIR